MPSNGSVFALDPMSGQRLGIYGGAFDPPHKAHAALIRAALAQLHLDQIRVFPSGMAWHKSRPLSPAVHRLAMARLAFASIPGVCIDARELQRPGPTYTVDTLRELRVEHPQAAFFLLMGEDQYRCFSTWREHEAIAAMARLVVCRREEALLDAPAAAPSFQKAPQKTPQTTIEPASKTEAWGAIHLDWRPMDLSSTAIRQARVGATDGLEDTVARYIAQHQLYCSSL